MQKIFLNFKANVTLTALRLQNYYLEKCQLGGWKTELTIQPPHGLKYGTYGFARFENCSNLPVCSRKII